MNPRRSCRTTIAESVGRLPASGERRDSPRAIDLPDAVVVDVCRIEISCCVERNVEHIADARLHRRRSFLRLRIYAAAPGDRRDPAGRCVDSPHTCIRRVGDEEISGRVDRHPARAAQNRRRRDATIPRESSSACVNRLYPRRRDAKDDASVRVSHIEVRVAIEGEPVREIE
jgi:hypothetical protein